MFLIKELFNELLLFHTESLLGICQSENYTCPLKERGFPGGSDGKESACNAGDPGWIPGSGRSLEKGMATLSSILVWKNPKERGSRWATGHGITESDTTEWPTQWIMAPLRYPRHNAKGLLNWLLYMVTGFYKGKLQIVRWRDSPGLSGCTQCIHKSSYKYEIGGPGKEM